jgi:hypothetical protein
MHIVKNIDLEKLQEAPVIPVAANTTRHIESTAKDIGIFDFELPDEET